MLTHLWNTYVLLSIKIYYEPDIDTFIKCIHIITNHNILLIRYAPNYEIHTSLSITIYYETDIDTFINYTHIIINHNVLLTRYKMHTHHYQSQCITNQISTHLLNAHTLTPFKIQVTCSSSWYSSNFIFMVIVFF